MFNKQTASQKMESLFKLLDQGSQKDFQLILSNSRGEILVDSLKSIEKLFITYHEEGIRIMENSIPERFYMLLVKVIDWERITSEPKYSCVYTIVYLLSRWCPVSSSMLIENDIVKALVKILKLEHSKGVTISNAEERGVIVNTASLISQFCPALPSSPCFKDVNDLARAILFSGHCFDEDEEDYQKEEILIVLRSAFLSVYNICRGTNSLPIHKVLLLKMIHWANALDVLEQFITIRVLVSYIKSSIFAEEVHSVIISTAMMYVLASKYSTLFSGLKVRDAMQNVRSLIGPNLSDGKHEWMEEFYDLLSSTEQNEEQRHLRLIRYCFGNETYSNTLHLRSKLIRLTLEFILPHMKDGTNAKYDLKLCYSRLRSFIEIVINVQKNEGQLYISSDGIECFKGLVSYVVETIDDLQALNNELVEFPINFDVVQDIKDVPNLYLGLCISSSISSIFSASKQLTELINSPTAQALVLLSLLYEVNENWGLLFCNLTPERMIDITCFRSVNFERSMSEQLDLYKNDMIDSPDIFEKIVTSFPFLLSFSLRKDLFYHLLSENRDNIPKEFCITNVPRRNIIEFLENYQLDELNPWDLLDIKFRGEIGSGSGPTKEFYSLLSKECQRKDLNIWIGEAAKGVDGMVYTSSTCGLFPLPHRSAKGSTLNIIGGFMVKAIWDNIQLDIHLSPAFYKALFNFRGQSLILNDIKDVMPNVYNFVKGLVDVLREKHIIMENKNLTPEEKLKAISKITCNGSSFKDLFLNFTVPGFPEIEMMKDGSDTDLTIDNLDLYLKYLFWWLFHSNSSTTINRIRTAFQTYLPTQSMKLFYPEEVEKLLCGVTVENWTVDYLKERCCFMDGLSADTPSVQHLFEILSSLSPSDQRLFLQFVTSSPRLPLGGFENLDPPLTIARSGSETSLPTSMTCFNVLFISDYVSKEVLQEKLLLAIREGSDSFQFV